MLLIMALFPQIQILCKYKFLRNVNFMDDPNLGFPQFIFMNHLLSYLVLQVYYKCFVKFTFMDDAKSMSLKNLYEYGQTLHNCDQI